MISRRGHASPEARAREDQTRFIEDSVKKVDKHFGSICNELGSVCRKTGRLRDKYDNVAKLCVEYAKTEPEPLKTSMTHFAERLSAIQDYRDAQIQRLEHKVINPLTTYGKECKHTQANLKSSIKTRNEEMKQHDKVETLRNKSGGDRHALTQAEAELQRRMVDVERTTRVLEETADKFESKKIQDLKKIFMEFIKVEMLFHAKALEQYSAAFNGMQNIQEEEHIAMFRNTLRPTTNMQNRMDLVNQTADMSLGDANRPATNQQLEPTPRPRNSAQPSDQHTSRSRDQEDDEDDDDDYDSEEDSQEYDDDEEDDDDEDEDDDVEEISPQRNQRARTKPW
uniref:Protein FAM92A1-like n=1 Tax=Phallusia mammillata TaxID=59560 RepID=A0A6F9DD97_9ASCI|nr:protein FAM92A1-like [Phallusia mammillata]